MKKVIFIVTLFLCFSTANSQVLISLIFGDKLNSPNLEFGLAGGVNFSKTANLEGANTATDFNLGFYFDYKIIKNTEWMLSTGVLVKSTVGAEGIPVYSLNNENLDNTFAGGFVDRKVNYFYVPIMMKYKFENNIYLKGGTQLGLLGKAFDEFNNNYDGENVEYKKDIRDQIHVIDAGLAAGLGYRLTKGNGMNLEIQYYYGLVTVMKGDSSPNQYNRSLYLTVGIPIGKGKAAKKAAAEKAAAENGVVPTGK
jgi:hypothetical protein